MNLIEAARKGEFDVVRKLVAEGADVNSKSDSGWSPILEASMNGHTEIVDFLLTHGSDINDVHYNSNSTPLLLAVKYKRYDTVKYLLMNNATSIQDLFCHADTTTNRYLLDHGLTPPINQKTQEAENKIIVDIKMLSAAYSISFNEAASIIIIKNQERMIELMMVDNTTINTSEIEGLLNSGIDEIKELISEINTD